MSFLQYHLSMNLKKKKKTSGLPPGSIIYTGKKTDLPVYVNYIEYNPDHCKEIIRKRKHEVVLRPSESNLVQWYDIRGLHDVELMVLPLPVGTRLLPASLEARIERAAPARLRIRLD